MAAFLCITKNHASISIAVNSTGVLWTMSRLYIAHAVVVKAMYVSAVSRLPLTHTVDTNMPPLK